MKASEGVIAPSEAKVNFFQRYPTDVGERLGFAFGVLIDEENHEKEGYAVYSIRNDESRNQDKSIGIFSK